MKAAIYVHHLATGQKWESSWEECSKADWEGMEDLLQMVCKEGTCFQINTEDGGTLFLPKEIIQQCAFQLMTKDS